MSLCYFALTPCVRVPGTQPPSRVGVQGTACGPSRCATLSPASRRCTAQRQRIVLPEGGEPRALRAAAEVTRRGLADITLLGNAQAIQARTVTLSPGYRPSRTATQHERKHEL